MSTEGWRYYKHAAISTRAPHEEANLSAIESGEIWNLDKKKPLFARWVSDFDCGYETQWWYVIKDDTLTLEQCKKKVRKELRRINDKIEIRIIEPEKYGEDIKKVYHKAVSAYKTPDVDLYLKKIEIKDDEEWIGSFDKENGELIAYKVARLHKEYVEMVTAKVNPEYNKYSPLLAMNFFQIERYINSGLYRYMSNGARTILHQTRYNDFLVEKLGFRKAYCRINIVYKRGVKIVVYLLFPFRNFLKLFNSLSLVRKINGVLEMEGINRSFH